MASSKTISEFANDVLCLQDHLAQLLEMLSQELDSPKSVTIFDCAERYLADLKKVGQDAEKGGAL